MSLSTFLGLAIGTSAASRGGTSMVARGWINLAFSVPIYWSSSLAILAFSVLLRWLPAYEQGTLAGYILPVGVLTFHTSGTIARVTQANVEAYQSATFVWSARSRGLSERSLLWKHILPNALPPVVSVIALQTGFLLSGTVLVETIFLRNGLGRLLLDSVFNRDYVVVQGIVVLSAVSYTLLSMLSSVVNSILDPRLRR
jgi:peptide/nickel transport system permease protein